ncbi:MAG: HlyD family secretion protein [Nitrospirae bacterium]|nr:HlyD family secretion protein [Nitrospirota bacterium]
MDEKTPENGKRKKIALFVFMLIGIAGAVTLYLYLEYKASHIDTDDAFIEGTRSTVASKVAGTVKAVHVRDNQAVKKGDLLIEIEPADYEVKVMEASSALSREQSRIHEIDAAIETSKKQLAEAKAKAEAAKANLHLKEAYMKQAETDAKRAENLFAKGAISKERHEKTLTAHNAALAELKAAEEEFKKSESSVETHKALIKQAETSKTSQQFSVKQRDAMLKASELSYGYTKIYAQADGQITKKSVELGNQIQAGQPLMAIVLLSDIWVVANYKETQLEKIKPGQRVEIKIDTYPNVVLFGRVDSIMSGTGTVFSLFPPENAAGNYVKVVQRVPVKIVLDNNSTQNTILRVGMSVMPTIIVK